MNPLMAKRLKHLKKRELERITIEYEVAKEEYEALCTLCNLLAKEEKADK